MNALRIAVCDDELVDLTYAMELLAAYNRQKQYYAEAFFKASDLLEKTDFDIVLLDIEMSRPTGFEIAQQLAMKEFPPVIIFTTKHNAYAVKGYGLALRYLQKPLEKQAFFDALDAAILEATAHRLTVSFEDVTHTIRVQEIRYIEVFGHYAVIHIGNDALRFRCSLKEITARLPRRYFAATHKSYVVNFEYIKSASANELWLSDGTRIPISRTKSAEFNQAFSRFLGR